MRFALLLSATVMGALRCSAGQIQEASELHVVVGDPQGAKIPKARIVLHRDEGQQTTEKIADSEGGAVFPDLPTGTYSFTVSAQGFQTKEQKARLDGGPTTIYVSLWVGSYSGPEVVADPVPVLIDETTQSPAIDPYPIPPQVKNRTRSRDSMLQIWVVDPQGAIVGNATLLLIDENTESKTNARVNEQGYAVLEVPAGNYRLLASAPGLLTSELHIHAETEVLVLTVRLNVPEVDCSRGPRSTPIQVMPPGELSNPEISPYPIEPLPQKKKKHE